jgi:hypothetical protein
VENGFDTAWQRHLRRLARDACYMLRRHESCVAFLLHAAEKRYNSAVHGCAAFFVSPTQTAWWATETLQNWV